MTGLARALRDVVRYRELVLLLVERDLKARYKRSVLGMFWSLLNPLLQMAVLSVVFSLIMRVDLPAFPLFLLAGLLPWTLVSVSVVGASVSLLNNQALIRKVAVPQMVYPLAIVGSKLVDTLLSLVPLAAIAAAFGRPPGPTWIFLPVALLLVTLFTVGISVLLASLTVFYRDLRHLTEVLIQVWFYLTPIFYPLEYLQDLPYPWLKYALLANPAAPLVELFHASVYQGRLPSAETLAWATAVAAGSFAIGLIAFLRRQHEHINAF